MYKVSDLTDKLGVARSTINDWLKSYDQFIDYSLQGKRKIYSQRTLDVLLEVNDLRSSGLSSHEIREELEKRHPLNGEVQEQKEITVEAPKNNDSSTEIAAPILFNDESLALMNKEQTEQLVAIINDRLQGVNTIKENINNRLDNIDERLGQINLADKIEVKKSSAALYFFILLIIFAIVGAGAFFAVEQFTKLSNERVALEKKNSELTTASQYISEKLDNVDTKLQTETKLNAETKAEYQRSLKQQRQDFKEEIKRLKAEAKKTNDTGKLYQTQIIELKDNLAKQQKILLEKIIKANKINTKNSEETAKANKIISKQNKINGDLTDKINNLVNKLKIIEKNKKSATKEISKTTTKPINAVSK